MIGKTDEKSDYSTATKIEELKALGYEVVSDGFPEEGLTFDSIDGEDQTFEVHLKHKHSDMTPKEPGKPGEPFDPAYPDGVKWPEGSDATKLEKKRNIDYVFTGDEDKNHTESETRTLERTGTVDHVTGEMIWADWGDTEAFKKAETPEEKGWTPDKQSVDELTVNPDMDDVTTETVTYTKDEVKEKPKPVDEKPQVKAAPKTGMNTILTDAWSFVKKIFG